MIDETTREGGAHRNDKSAREAAGIPFASDSSGKQTMVRIIEVMAGIITLIDWMGRRRDKRPKRQRTA